MNSTNVEEQESPLDITEVIENVNEAIDQINVSNDGSITTTTSVDEKTVPSTTVADEKTVPSTTSEDKKTE